MFRRTRWMKPLLMQRNVLLPSMVAASAIVSVAREKYLEYPYAFPVSVFRAILKYELSSPPPQPPTTTGTRGISGGARSDYLNWNEYFMIMAILAAQRSKDPVTQVGAVIVSPQQRVIGTGYNGFPAHCSDSVLPWCKTEPLPEQNKYHYVVHAELNAILNSPGTDSCRGSTMYVTRKPCHECVKSILQSGIARIVYLHDYDSGSSSHKSATTMLKLAGIPCIPFQSLMASSKNTIDSGDCLPDHNM